MKTKFSILILIFFSSLLSCKKKRDIIINNYNQKANELIEQIIILSPNPTDNCDCFLEFDKETILQIEEKYHKTQYSLFRNMFINELELNNDSELDSLDSISSNFVIDKNILKKHNIKIVTRNQIYNQKENRFKMAEKLCPKGILLVSKPIFDKNYKRALIQYGWPFMHGRAGIGSYVFKNNKWVADK